MKIKYFNIVTLLFVILTVLFTACGKSGEKAVITHLPVQMKSKGNWSLWDIKTGAILYEGEFKKAPSAVIEGVFITKNEDGDLFYNKIEDEKKFKEIAGPYRSGSSFSEGIAIVCKEESYPSAINTSGEEIFNLEPQEGVVIQNVGQCIDGMIKFQTDNGLWGFLDRKGKIAIKPQFDYVDDFEDGMARATLHTDSKDKFVIIDSEGKTISEVDKPYVGRITGNKMVYSDSKDEFGILSAKKEQEKILNASEKYERLSIDGDDIFYRADEEWGMIDEKGEILIRAKYKSLTRLSGDVYLGIKKDGDDAMYELLNKKGEVTKKEDIDEAINLRNGHFMVKDGKDFQIMDAEGKAVGTNTVKDLEGIREIIRVAGNYSDMVESDYFDWGKIKEYVGTIKSGSLAGFSLGVSCIQAGAQLDKLGKGSSGESDGKGDQGKGLVFETLVFDWRNNNGADAIFIGTGYEDKDSRTAEQAEADRGMDDRPSMDTTSAGGSGESIPDNAPGWSMYQSYLYNNISLGRSGSVGLSLSFDDYIKKAKTTQVPVDYGYTTYMEEKTVSYEKNPEAKVSGIVMEFTVQSDKQEKLQKLIDAAFSKGFTYTGAGYGGYGDVSASVKTYSDAAGNRWEVNGAQIKIFPPVSTVNEGSPY
jgi:hypothetical protein